MQSYHVEHFGCRAARADGEAIGDALTKAGLDSGKAMAADLVVVNTCSVTAEADRQARAFIRRVHRRNPDARIVVTGCYAQRAPEELAEIDGVDAVIGNSHKGLAPEIMLALGGKTQIDQPEVASLPQVSVAALLASTGSLQPGTAAQRIWADDRFAHSFLEEAQLTPGAQTRPNLKVQEGCSNHCSFCVIPQTRGASRSLAAETVLRQVEGFVAAGGNELVLSGINLGRWGRDLAKNAHVIDDKTSPRSLSALVRQILEETKLPRLRLSSIEPMDWDAEMIALLAEFAGPSVDQPRLARHLHLPLQSGSDGVLRRMYRRYRPWHYVAKVEALRAAAGETLTIGADVMVGFPGETDAEFAETVDLIRSLPMAYLHLFPFSPRPGTPGWELHRRSPVPPKVVDARMAVLQALHAEKSQAHRRAFLGKTLDVITLNTPAESAERRRTTALSENFLPIEVEGVLGANQLCRVKVEGIHEDGMLFGVRE